MLNRILKIIQDKIRKREYIMTLHGNEEMDDDSLSIFDIESCILSGKILERQKDKITAEWKYLIRGKSLSDDEVEIITKLSSTGKLVIITVYKL